MVLFTREKQRGIILNLHFLSYDGVALGFGCKNLGVQNTSYMESIVGLEIVPKLEDRFLKLACKCFFSGDQWDLIGEWYHISAASLIPTFDLDPIVKLIGSKIWLSLNSIARFLWPWALGPLHKRDPSPMTIVIQALSLVEKAELVQPCFTLRSKHKHSKWMHNGCKVYMDSYMASSG